MSRVNESSRDDSCESALKPASPELLAQARAWLAADPDRATRDELKKLIACNDGDALAQLFGSRLHFGTAGLRGALGPGPNRMNRVTVAHASAGFAAFLRETGREHPLVVVARDARTNSDVFADDAARVFAGAGARVIALPDPVPTPVLAFAVRHLDADAGVMITASHNPPGDNGYKVYLGGDDDGAQIVPPTDERIHRHIAAASAARFSEIPRGDVEMAGDDLIDAYVDATAKLAPATSGDFLRVAYTPLHGVGWAVFARVLERAGFPVPRVATRQAEPDGSFPTVRFPNPEEDGALDEVTQLAREMGADLVLAHDPDADRLAVSIPHGDGFRMLTGNELGAVLAWWVAEHETAGRSRRPSGTFATTYVSAPALERIAEHYGYACVRTPSGFKWIGRVPNLRYGFEEALGYLVNPDTLHDKDGISAALAIMHLTTELARRGETLGQLVDTIAAQFGGLTGESFSIRYPTGDEAQVVMDALRAHPLTELAGASVISRDDYLPDANLVAWNLGDGSRVLVRPSGTEPKLKVYVFADTPARVGELVSATSQVPALAAS